MTKPTINDARWQDWADKFLAAEQTDPGPDTTNMIMAFFAARRSYEEYELEELTAEFNKNFAFQVSVKHVERVGLKIDEEGLQFINLISDGLGSLVMNIHGARRLQQKLGAEILSMQELFENCFARGTRSDAVLHELWDIQKLTAEEREALGGGMDNYLDHVVNE